MEVIRGMELLRTALALLGGYFHNLAAGLLVCGTGIIIAALGANPVRELALVALRTLALRDGRQEIVGPPAA
jgi:hypothetical protein